MFIYTVDQFAKQRLRSKGSKLDESVVSLVLPVVGGVIALQAVHWTCNAKIHDVKLSLLAVPSVQLGLFGTVTRFLTFPKSRKALFDVAIAGPFAGFVASLTCILMGIDLTAHATPAELLNYPAIPTDFSTTQYFCMNSWSLFGI